MQLQPLYRATFTTPERWAVEVAGTHGTEVQDFLIAEGHIEGRLSARLRGANYPRRRADGTLLPDFRGALDTDDGATILFSWHGYARPGAADRKEIVGSITHLTGNERYAWLNNTVAPWRVRSGLERMKTVSRSSLKSPSSSGSHWTR